MICVKMCLCVCACDYYLWLFKTTYFIDFDVIPFLYLYLIWATLNGEVSSKIDQDLEIEIEIAM